MRDSAKIVTVAVATILKLTFAAAASSLCQLSPSNIPEEIMIRNLVLLTAVLIPVCVVGADAPVTAPPEGAGMKALFNGKDLTGWDGDPRLWSVKDGVIHGETTEANPAKGNTFIIWKDGRTKDFEL